MATKTQAAAVFLLLNMVFFTFTNGQLLSPELWCLTQTRELLTCCTALSLVQITGVTDTLTTACCGLFAGLTPQDSGACLCGFLRSNALRFNLNASIPGDIFIVLKTWGKQVTAFGC
ncbi:putative lipid-binding protein AIR1B [Wolffia australiana]